MKAVILSGSPGTALFPLANLYPKLAFPLLGEPLLVHLLCFLKRNGIKKVAVVSSEPYENRGLLVGNTADCRLDDMDVTFFNEGTPRGTAGTLRDLKSFIGDSHFLVISGSSYIKGLDFGRLLDYHLRRRAGVTVVVENGKNGNQYLENIKVTDDGLVKDVHILHHSRDNRRLLRPCGVYLFNPEVIDCIQDLSYVDIKEQLIPSLREMGIPVHAYQTKGCVNNVYSLNDYFRLNRQILLNGLRSDETVSCTKTEIRDRVWVGSDVKISPGAYLLGPLVICDGAVIDDGAQVIGPACIGRGARVAEGALLRESIIWDDARIEKGAKVEYSLVGRSCTVPEGKTVENGVVIEGSKCNGSFNFISISNDINNQSFITVNGQLKPVSKDTIRYRAFLFAKRLMDIALAGLGLVLTLPLMLLIALAVKIDSPGPVFFRQRRCGKEGREFTMYKFRTMRSDAQSLQDKLKERNNVDGPMFKIKNDPRLTRLGRFLRKTSLDELPQLWNVLKGDMSLVGPRPLVMDEMKFSPSWRDIRLKVKPGITGLWQISGRSTSPFSGWIKYDIYYVRHCSLLLDLKILLKTVRVVLKKVGAF